MPVRVTGTLRTSHFAGRSGSLARLCQQRGQFQEQAIARISQVCSHESCCRPQAVLNGVPMEVKRTPDLGRRVSRHEIRRQGLDEFLSHRVVEKPTERRAEEGGALVLWDFEQNGDRHDVIVESAPQPEANARARGCAGLLCCATGIPEPGQANSGTLKDVRRVLPRHVSDHHLVKSSRDPAGVRTAKLGHGSPRLVSRNLKGRAPPQIRHVDAPPVPALFHRWVTGALADEDLQHVAEIVLLIDSASSGGVFVGGGERVGHPLEDVEDDLAHGLDDLCAIGWGCRVHGCGPYDPSRDLASQDALVERPSVQGEIRSGARDVVIQPIGYVFPPERAQEDVVGGQQPGFQFAQGIGGSIPKRRHSVLESVLDGVEHGTFVRLQPLDDAA